MLGLVVPYRAFGIWLRLRDHIQPIYVFPNPRYPLLVRVVGVCRVRGVRHPMPVLPPFEGFLTRTDATFPTFNGCAFSHT